MSIRSILKSTVRFFIIWFVNALAIIFTIWIISGITYVSAPDTSLLFMATAGAFILGVVNFVIRPILLLLAVPFGGVFIFLVGLFVNAIALMITSNLFVSFQIDPGDGLSWEVWFSRRST